MYETPAVRRGPEALAVLSFLLCGCSGAGMPGPEVRPVAPPPSAEPSPQVLCAQVSVQPSEGFEPVAWPKGVEPPPPLPPPGFVSYELRWNVPVRLWRCDDSVERPPNVLLGGGSAAVGGSSRPRDPLITRCDQQPPREASCPEAPARRLSGRVDVSARGGIRDLGSVRVGVAVPRAVAGHRCRPARGGDDPGVEPRLVVFAATCDGRRFAWRGPLRIGPEAVTEAFAFRWVDVGSEGSEGAGSTNRAGRAE